MNLLLKMGLLNMLSGNKIQSQVESIKINDQNVNVNTSHVQWLKEIKIGIEIVVIFIIILALAIIIKKIYICGTKTET